MLALIAVGSHYRPARGYMLQPLPGHSVASVEACSREAIPLEAVGQVRCSHHLHVWTTCHNLRHLRAARRQCPHHQTCKLCQHRPSQHHCHLCKRFPGRAVIGALRLWTEPCRDCQLHHQTWQPWQHRLREHQRRQTHQRQHIFRPYHQDRHCSHRAFQRWQLEASQLQMSVQMLCSATCSGCLALQTLLLVSHHPHLGCLQHPSTATVH
mmetsp:Transcript_25515/g.48266  ORF Transcript_25515/g.48266 Transcript_25515/m.48266 type:complete len:210 (+) Transcript_25515:944-1573(+)